jgi:hypothetical protein
MALSTALARPFRLSGLELPPQTVLLCRLLALTLLLTWHVGLIQTPFLPFVPGLDELPGVPFQRALQGAVVLGSLAVLFSTRLRLAALVTGSALLLAIVSSRAYYGNNKAFTALLLILAAAGDIRLLRWQVAILYFGAGLNKALDPDWHSGQFFHHWAGTRLENPLYLWAAPLLPPLVLGKIFCWATIVIELALAGMMPFRRFAWPAIWIAALFQCGLLLFTGQTFTLFFFASQISLLAFVEWPKERITVIWDGECGFCAQTKDRINRFDADRHFRLGAAADQHWRTLGLDARDFGQCHVLGLWWNRPQWLRGVPGDGRLAAGVLVRSAGGGGCGAPAGGGGAASFPDASVEPDRRGGLPVGRAESSPLW